MPYFLLLFICSGWLFFLLFMAYIKNSSIWYQLTYAIIGMTCHQVPQKSFYFMHNQIPVCGRCFGIYTGLIIGLLVYPLFFSIKNKKVPDLKLAWIFILPVLIDGIFDILPTNPQRMITGIIFGAGIIFFLLPVLNDIHYSQKN